MRGLKYSLNGKGYKDFFKKARLVTTEHVVRLCFSLKRVGMLVILSQAYSTFFIARHCSTEHIYKEDKKIENRYKKVVDKEK